MCMLTSLGLVVYILHVVQTSFGVVVHILNVVQTSFGLVFLFCADQFKSWSPSMYVVCMVLASFGLDTINLLHVVYIDSV